jgi:hypothetical protein
MLTATLLCMLHASPSIQPAFLNDSAPRRARLVRDETEGPILNYEGWSRAQLRVEYERIEKIRPGVFLPVTMIIVGLSGGAISGIVLASQLTSFFGVVVMVAAGLTVGIVIGVGLAIIGTILLVRLSPERRALGKQLDEIEAMDRELYRRSRNNCPEVPSGPGEPSQLQQFQPQVMAPSSYPITLAVF